MQENNMNVEHGFFPIGAKVIKQGEDSRFDGVVVAWFYKRNKKTLRYVVENDDGVLHIASHKQLQWANLTAST